MLENTNQPKVLVWVEDGVIKVDQHLLQIPVGRKDVPIKWVMKDSEWTFTSDGRSFASARADTRVAAVANPTCRATCSDHPIICSHGRTIRSRPAKKTMPKMSPNFQKSDRPM